VQDLRREGEIVNKKDIIEAGDQVRIVAEKGVGEVAYVLHGVASVDYEDGRTASIRVTMLQLVTKAKKKGGKEETKRRAK
jgi:hypothetical protein